MFKQEVKAYYRQVRDQQPITASEFKDFLLQESKVASISAQHSRGSRDPEISRWWPVFVISETRKRVQRGGGAQRALQVHPSLLPRGQPRALGPEYCLLESSHFSFIYLFFLTFPHFHRLQIKEKMDENGAPSELTKQLHHVRDLFDGLKSCSWNWVAVFYWTEVNGGDRTPRCTYYVGQRRVCPRCIPAVTGARDKETRRHDKARTHCSLTHLEPPTKPVCVFLTCESPVDVQKLKWVKAKHT